MPKRLCLLFAVLVLTGCARKPEPQAQAPRVIITEKEAPRAEVRIGGDDPDEQRRLPFKITAIYEKHKPSTEPPFRIKDGEWTFFDCQASSDPRVVFTVGVASKGSSDKVPVAWGNALLIVPDQQAGARFTELFSKAFAGNLPTPVKRVHVPKPLAIKTAILGNNMKREGKGGFSGEAGDWTATKWFPEHDGHSGEVYFNYSLGKKRGEFSEKDADYADDLVVVFATALRDGSRPERTPENDPNLTRIGPRIGQPRKLLSRHASHYSFSPKAGFAVYQDGSTIFALSLDKPDSKPFAIGRFDHSPWDRRVLNEDLTLLVQEPIPQNSVQTSSLDPMRIWWLDHKRREKKLLRGPEVQLSLAEVAISPDHRYVALNQFLGKPGEKSRREVLYILDRESGQAKLFDLPSKHLFLVGWKKTEAGLRGVVVTNRYRIDENEASELYLADPISGKLERQENVDARFEIDNLLSPDGKHRVRIDKDALVVTDVADGKQHRFVLHADDRRFVGEEDTQWVIQWVSSRYLKFNGARLALIDVTTMKMSFPPLADGTTFVVHSCKFSPDFRWLLYQAEGSDGLFLAPVEMPKEE